MPRGYLTGRYDVTGPTPTHGESILVRDRDQVIARIERVAPPGTLDVVEPPASQRSRLMRAKIFLADSAEIREGLLFLLAGGWSEVGPSPQPFAIAGLIEVEWDETNARHALELTIENEDGAPLVVPTPTGDQPVRVASEFEVGRPAGSARGSSFNMALAVPIIPLPWTPGCRYVVRLRIDGADVDQVRFAVRQGPPSPQR